MTAALQSPQPEPSRWHGVLSSSHTTLVCLALASGSPFTQYQRRVWKEKAFKMELFIPYDSNLAIFSLATVHC